MTQKLPKLLIIDDDAHLRHVPEVMARLDDLLPVPEVTRGAR